MAEKTLAKFVYRSGNKLLLPKYGNALMLFFEFIRDRSHPLSMEVPIRVFTPGNEAEAEVYFCVRMDNQGRETFEDAVEYINANL